MSLSLREFRRKYKVDSVDYVLRDIDAIPAQ